MRIRLQLVSVVALTLLLGVWVQAAPSRVTLSGHATDAAGVPLDGAQTFTFRAYFSDDPAAPHVWQEKLVLDVVGGDFTAELGTTTPFGPELAEASDSLWFGIAIDPDPELEPRLRASSVPYAHASATADSLAGFTPDDFVPVGQSCSSGQVAMGIDASGQVICTKLSPIALTGDPADLNGPVAPVFIGGSPPGSPEPGRLWFDSTASKLYVYDGSDWLEPTGSGSGSGGELSLPFVEIVSGTLNPFWIRNSQAGGDTTAVRGTVDSPGGIAGQFIGGEVALQGEASEPGAVGVRGFSQGGPGVVGESNSPLQPGGEFQGQAYGILATATSNIGTGILAISEDPNGGGQGVTGISDGTSGEGVEGRATAGSGVTKGVYGLSFSPDGRGVHGLGAAGSGSPVGVHGEVAVPGGVGVWGEGAGGAGVRGTTTTGAGVEGTATSNSGVGVRGIAPNLFGVGVRGVSPTASSVAVEAISEAVSGAAIALLAQTLSPAGLAAHFIGDVLIDGDLDLNGSLNLGGDLDINGALTANFVDAGGGLSGFALVGEFITANQSLTSDGTLSVAGSTQLGGHVTVSGNVSSSGVVSGSSIQTAGSLEFDHGSGSSLTLVGNISSNDIFADDGDFDELECDFLDTNEVIIGSQLSSLPSGELQVRGQLDSGTSPFRVTVDGDDRLRVRSDGSVAVGDLGSSTPTTPGGLTVIGDSYFRNSLRIGDDPEDAVVDADGLTVEGDTNLYGDLIIHGTDEINCNDCIGAAEVDDTAKVTPGKTYTREISLNLGENEFATVPLGCFSDDDTMLSGTCYRDSSNLLAITGIDLKVRTHCACRYKTTNGFRQYECTMFSEIPNMDMVLQVLCLDGY